MVAAIYVRLQTKMNEMFLKKVCNELRVAPARKYFVGLCDYVTYFTTTRNISPACATSRNQTIYLVYN